MKGIKTIKDLSLEIGVSKQAIFKKMQQEPLAAQLAPHIVKANKIIFLDIEGEALVKSAFGGAAAARAQDHDDHDSKKAQNHAHLQAMLQNLALQEQIAEKNNQIDAMTAEIEIKNKHIENLNTQLEIKDRHISKITALAEANEAEHLILTDPKERYMDNLMMQLAVKDEMLKDLRIQLKDTTLALLFAQQTAATAQSLYNSKVNMQTLNPEHITTEVFAGSEEARPKKKGLIKRMFGG